MITVYMAILVLKAHTMTLEAMNVQATTPEMCSFAQRAGDYYKSELPPTVDTKVACLDKATVQKIAEHERCVLRGQGADGGYIYSCRGKS